MSVRLSVSVPATSANLGPGFDTLGLTLDLHLRISATPAEAWVVTTSGEGAGTLAEGSESLIAQAYGVMCRRQQWEPRPLSVASENNIPIGRGLGSSAAATAAGMALGQLLNLGHLDPPSLFLEAADMERHADNVAAAIFGGLQQVHRHGESYVSESRRMDGSIKVLLAIPDEMSSTADMRKVVAADLAEADQIHNTEALQQVLAGLANGDPAGLRFSQSDRGHQPQRLAVLPKSAAIFNLLMEVPELAGIFLSGAGPTVAGWVVGSADPTGSVRQLLEDHQIAAKVMLVAPVANGVDGALTSG